MSDVRWLFLDLNSFFASCEQQEQPHLRGKPMAVVPVEAESTCAIAASYPAKAKGVRTGTKVSDARALCPGIQFVKARPKLYVEYHHRILKAIDRFMPVEAVVSIDEVACKLMGKEQELPVAIELARKIKQAIQKDVGECLTSSVGLAPNRFLAKLASNMQKPDGLTPLTMADLPEKLYPLTLQAFPGIGPRMKQRLYRHGIFDTRQLWNLDTLRMRAIWGGIGGLKFHSDLHGLDLRKGETQTSVMSHEHVLEPALRNITGGLEVLRQLLIKGAERMRRNGYYCKRLGVHVRLAKHQGYFENGVSFPEMQDTTFLLARLQELWQAFPAGYVPMKVGITLSDFVPVSAHQQDMFESTRSPGLLLALDKINRKYGRHTISFGLNETAKSAGKDKIAFQRVPEVYEVA